MTSSESPPADRQPSAAACPVSTFNEWDPLEEIIVGVVADALIPPWETISSAVVHDETQWEFSRAEGGKRWPERFACDQPIAALNLIKSAMAPRFGREPLESSTPGPDGLGERSTPPSCPPDPTSRVWQERECAALAERRADQPPSPSKSRTISASIAMTASPSAALGSAAICNVMPSMTASTRLARVR